MNANKWLLLFLLIVATIAGCSPTVSGDGLSSAPRAWFDAPLPGTVFFPPNPCLIVAHGASPNGIAVFELFVNGEAISIPSPDTASSLVTLNRDCAMNEPGTYALQLRAQDNQGNWSAYAETYFVIPGAAAGTIGGAVFGDLNGNGLQETSEVGLGDVDVVLKGCGPDKNQTTNTNGVFLFANVPAGSCTLEVFKGGWGFSGSNPSLGYPIPVASDPNLPTNLGILMAPMSDNIPPEPTLTPVVSVADEISITGISTPVIFVGASSCGPMEVVITAHAKAAKGITTVVLFYRLPGTDFLNTSMNPIGNDNYRGTISMAAIFGDSVPFDQATLEYQVVVQQSDGDTSLRTPLLGDVGVQACGAPSQPQGGDSGSGGQTDACNAYTDQRTCIAKGCNWWQINDTTFVCRSKP